MTARSIWKGEIKIGTTRIPVKLYSAITDQTVRFHILGDKHRTRVKQHMVIPDSGDVVPNEEIRKGYEVEAGKFVILTEQDLDSLNPKPSREIEISEFVSPEKISQQYYERPYYLGPDGNEKNYFALAAALSNREREGIAHWVMRNKDYSGALRADNGYLMLYTLRTSDEVISAADLPTPLGRAPSQKEVEMAKHLISLLEGEFNPADYKDEYRKRVMEFVDRKAKGHAPRLSSVKSKRQTTSLDSVLAKSIATLKKGKRAA
jgi:DNA end-binding protein Ku